MSDEVGNVVSITRAGRWSRDYDKPQCKHLAIFVDTALAMIKCKTCGEALNPIEWIARLGERWDEVKRNTQLYREAKAEYEAKKKARCEHCGKMTKLRPASPAQVRAFKRGTVGE